MVERVPIIDDDGLGGLADWLDGGTAELCEGALAAGTQPTTTMSAAVTRKSVMTVVIQATIARGCGGGSPGPISALWWTR